MGQRGWTGWAGLGLALALMTGGASGASYYVSTSGDDGNTGTNAQTPFRNVTHALSVASDGDRILLGPGEYRERLSVTQAVELAGADTYDPDAPAFSRHGSRSILRPPDTNLPDRALITLTHGNVRIHHLTLDGDADGDGVGDAKYGVYSTNRPLVMTECSVRFLRGYGICNVGDDPPPAPDDDDSLRAFFANNHVTDITHTSLWSAAGLLLRHVPATCVSNTFRNISGSNALAGLFLESCYYTGGMTQELLVCDNVFDNCMTAIRANKFGTGNEGMRMERNVVTAGLLGIMITGAKGPATLLENRIWVGGTLITSNVLPARGIWIQADYAPWHTNYTTVHVLVSNYVADTCLGTNGTVGLLFQYDLPPPHPDNNGVRARVVGNRICWFDYGVAVLSGTNNVSRPHDPLVDVVFRDNDILRSTVYSAVAAGPSNTVNAISNWWGSAGGPTGGVAMIVSTNVLYIPWLGTNTYPDTDGDLVPDTLDADDDDDGAPDPDEAIAGTDPLSERSVFLITGWAVDANGRYSLTWNSVTNRIYHVYRTTNLLVTPWSQIAAVTGSPPTETFLDPSSILRVQCYYRVRTTN